MVDLQKLHDAILNGDAKTSAAVTLDALGEKVPPIEIIQKAMVPAMDEVARRFECQDYFVPELLLSARAMKVALEPLRPLLAASGVQRAGKGRDRYRERRSARHRQEPGGGTARRRRLAAAAAKQLVE